MNLSIRPIGDIRPNPRNTRKHGRAQIARLAKSLDEFGFQKPVVVDASGMILAGHGIYEAALLAGIDDVPVVESSLDEMMSRAYMIADNKLAELSKWDDALLDDELTELYGSVDFDALGFVRWTPKGRKDLNEKTIDNFAERVAYGDTWQLGDHLLRCVDCCDADAVRDLMSHKPRLMVADPPYGVNLLDANRDQSKKHYVEDDSRIDYWAAFDAFDGSTAHVWCSHKQIIGCGSALEDRGFKLRGLIIWAKDRPNPGRSTYHWQHEQCWYATRSSDDRPHVWTGAHKSTLWDIPKLTKSETGHAAERPLEVHLRSIENHTEPKDCVFDPFMGSGTTIMAAEVSGRRAIGCEINPRFCDVIVARWESATGGKAKKVG